MKHLIVYIPGLGDRYEIGYLIALKLWRIFGFKTQLVSVKWYKSGTYEEKLHRAMEAVRIGIADGYTVTLLGASAGASLAINVAAKVPGIHKVILVAGVNNSDISISEHIRRRSPSFAESAKKVSVSLRHIDIHKIHTIRGLTDATVHHRYSVITGAHAHVVFSLGHAMTIFLCLTIFSPLVASIVRSK